LADKNFSEIKRAANLFFRRHPKQAVNRNRFKNADLWNNRKTDKLIVPKTTLFETFLVKIYAKTIRRIFEGV
jgi:hypothetical protein